MRRRVGSPRASNTGAATRLILPASYIRWRRSFFFMCTTTCAVFTTTDPWDSTRRTRSRPCRRSAFLPARLRRTTITLVCPAASASRRDPTRRLPLVSAARPPQGPPAHFTVNRSPVPVERTRPVSDSLPAPGGGGPVVVPGWVPDGVVGICEDRDRESQGAGA